MNDKPMIDPQNLPIWTAAGFIVALLALVLAFIGLYRSNVVVLATQAEVLALDKKIQELGKPQPGAPQSPAEKAAE